MTFLNSIFLAALAAVIIPLLIHFLSRKRIKIIDFSSLKFLFQMQKSKLRWLRILEILLLLLRMLVLALIVMAFARPAFTGKATSSHASASIVVLIDNSPSVETLSPSGTIFDDIKNAVAELIGILNPGDEVTIITLSGTIETSGPFSDFERMRNQLYALRPGYSSPAFNTGLKKAAAILSKSHNLNREIYIVSDMQNGDWWNIDKEDIDPAIRYFSLKYNNSEIENIGINRIDFPTQLLAPGEEFTIKPIIRNYSDKAINSKLVELFIDGQKKAQTAVDLKPYGIQNVEFKLSTDLPGIHQGYFQIEDDDYSPDNQFFFNYDIPRRISILGVGGSKSDVSILRGCFGVDNNSYLNFTGMEISGFSRTNLSGYDVVILNNVSALSELQFNNLADYVLNGGGLCLIFGSDSNPESYSAFLKKYAKIELSEKITAMNVDINQSYYQLKIFNLTHPIFVIYEPGNQYQAEIPELKLFEYIPLKGGISLANLEDDKSVMVHSQVNKVIISGFELARPIPVVSFTPLFVPMVTRAVKSRV